MRYLWLITIRGHSRWLHAVHYSLVIVVLFEEIVQGENRVFAQIWPRGIFQ